MTTRRHASASPRRAARAVTCCFLLSAFDPVGAAAAVKPGLAGAQDLYRQNRWEEARAHLRAAGTLPEKDQAVATFLMGRSYVREAEFYRAVRRIENEVGLAYLAELSASKANQGVAWVSLFTGLYQLESEKYQEAERTLLASATSTRLTSAEWKAVARLRRAVAVRHLGRAAEAAAVEKDTSPEAHYWRLVLKGQANTPPAVPKPGRRERLASATVLFRADRRAEAEALLAGINLDVPDVEDKTDPKKVLRFHDPLTVAAWERVCWERAAATLVPLVSGAVPGAGGTERSLAAYYAGLSLFFLGAAEDAGRLLRQAGPPAPSPDLEANGRLLLSSLSWRANGLAAEMGPLWESAQAHAESVLLWEELRRPMASKSEPFATKLDARLRDLLKSSPERPAGATVGRWGLVQLRREADAAEVLATLSEFRDKSNKNKLEWNDPLLLVALSGASYRQAEYSQALETLFEMSKTFPGLRALQWNMQGVYAARQKAGGEARISQ